MADKKDPMTPEELAELLAEGEGEVDIEDDDEAGREGEEEGGKQKAAPGAQGDGDAPDGEVEVEPDPEPDAKPDLNEIFQIPPDAKARLEAIEKELDAIEAKWDAGDIGDAEFKRAIKDLNAERGQIGARIEAARVYAHQAQTSEAAAEDRRWKESVATFKAGNPDLWKDEHRARFNEHVKAVTSDSRYASMSFDQQLRLAANSYISERTALDLPAPKLGKAAQPAGLAAKADRRPPLPQTLARLPAAEANETDSRFAHIERMEAEGDVDGAEAAVARLSEADRAAYLRGE